MYVGIGKVSHINNVISVETARVEGKITYCNFTGLRFRQSIYHLTYGALPAVLYNTIVLGFNLTLFAFLAKPQKALRWDTCFNIPECHITCHAKCCEMNEWHFWKAILTRAVVLKKRLKTMTMICRGKIQAHLGS
jgi:hypothetical protein